MKKKFILFIVGVLIFVFAIDAMANTSTMRPKKKKSKAVIAVDVECDEDKRDWVMKEVFKKASQYNMLRPFRARLNWIQKS